MRDLSNRKLYSASYAVAKCLSLHLSHTRNVQMAKLKRTYRPYLNTSVIVFLTKILVIVFISRLTNSRWSVAAITRALG